MIPGGIIDSCLVGQETHLTTAGGAIPVGRETVSFWQTVPLCSGKELLAVEMESFTSLLIRVQDEPLWIIFRRDMVIRLKDELIMAGVPCIAIQYVTNIIIHGINIHHCKPGGNGSKLPTNRERGSQNNDFSLSTVVYEPLRDTSVSAIAFHPVLLMVVTSRFGLAIVKVIRMINWFRGLDGHAMLLVHKGRNP